VNEPPHPIKGGNHLFTRPIKHAKPTRNGMDMHPLEGSQSSNNIYTHSQGISREYTEEAQYIYIL
jgi:hypothetical protein